MLERHFSILNYVVNNRNGTLFFGKALLVNQGFFLVIFPQTLVNLFSETLSLRKKSLSLDEKFGILLQKTENFSSENFYQQKLQKGLWNPLSDLGFPVT